MRTSKRQRGFTLIELIAVTAILGILGGISLQTFKDQRSRAYYANIRSLLRDGMTALNASVVDDRANSLLSMTTLSTPGPVTSPATVAAILPGLNLPKNVRFHVFHDPDCIDSSCVADFMQSNHCFGEEYTNWTRFGDGVELRLERIAGAGCAITP